MELFVNQVIFFFFSKLNHIKNNKHLLEIFCSEIPNEGNATWDETFADGSTVSGTCLSGYYGTISRTCSQAGLSTLWGPISGSCNGIYLFREIILSLLMKLINNLNSNSCLLFIYSKRRKCRMGTNIS